MEAVWILAGVVVGVGVAYLAAGRGRLGAVPEATWEPRVKALESDIERLRLDFQDTLDKITHLYERIRKRIQPAELTPGNGAEAVTLSPNERKAAIRARARMGGLLK